MREIQGTKADLPAQLSYGVNMVSADATNNNFKFPDARTGQKVSVINLSGFDINIYPPNNTGTIDTLSEGSFISISSGQTYNEFICIKNPTVSVWVNTQPNQFNKIEVPLGTLSISHTTGSDTIWNGTDITGTSGDGSNGGWGATPDNNWGLSTPSNDSWTIQSPTELFILKGFKMYTDVPITSRYYASQSFPQSVVIGQNGTVQTVGLYRNGLEDSNIYNLYDTGAFAGQGSPYDPSQERFLKPYYNTNLATNCWMVESNTLGSGIIMSHLKQPNAPLTTIPYLSTFRTKYGQGAFQTNITLKSQMATKTYNFDLKMIVDFVKK